MRWRLVLVTLALATGCASAPRVEGLHVLEPPVRATWKQPPKVDSLQPTLRWNPYPPTSDIHVVGYDVRIWQAEFDAFRLPIGATLVYERDSLPQPSHTVETSLEPKKLYVWTVRPRLEIDGARRVGEWSRFTLSPFYLDVTAIPDRGYFRFRTP